MLKNISVVLLLALVGCGGSGGSISSKSATVADAKLLAKGAISVKEFGDSFKKDLSDNINIKKTKAIVDVSEECVNGSMSYDMSDKYINALKNGLNPKEYEISIIAKNCEDIDGNIANGTMSFNISLEDSDNSFDVTFPTDYTETTKEGTYKIFKGGSLHMQGGEIYDTMVMNLKMSEDDITYEGKNLVYKIKDEGDRVETFPISGEESFGNGVLFRVDTDYDASKTPMVEIDEKLQSGGLFKYIDGVGHRVEVEATGIDEVTVWVDENADGKRSENELGIIRD
jgi:hypothetical protein